MEATTLMDFNLELTDPVAIKMWPAVEVPEERNQVGTPAVHGTCDTNKFTIRVS